MVKSYRNSFTDEDGEVSVRVFTSFVDQCIGILTEKKNKATSSESNAVEVITQSLKDADMNK